jgi:hypothetical protein
MTRSAKLELTLLIVAAIAVLIRVVVMYLEVVPLLRDAADLAGNKGD